MSNKTFKQLLNYGFRLQYYYYFLCPNINCGRIISMKVLLITHKSLSIGIILIVEICVHVCGVLIPKWCVQYPLPTKNNECNIIINWFIVNRVIPRYEENRKTNRNYKIKFMFVLLGIITMLYELWTYKCTMECTPSYHLLYSKQD